MELTKAQQKKQDAVIERLYLAVGQNVQIDIFDIPRVFAVGRKLFRLGKSEEEVQAGIAELVAQIRRN